MTDPVAQLAAAYGAYVSPLDDLSRPAEPLAPRPASVDGRRIALLDITKNRGAEFLDRVEVHLQAAGATTWRVSKEMFSKPAEPELLQGIANRGDLVVEGLAD